MAKYYKDGNFASKNEEKWFYWNRKAAINGNTYCQFKLVEYYLNDSVNKNERKAFNWCLKLANEYLGSYLVAKCYRDGIGTDKNLFVATKWFEIYESLTYDKHKITLNDFLNGSDIMISYFN